MFLIAKRALVTCAFYLAIAIVLEAVLMGVIFAKGGAFARTTIPLSRHQANMTTHAVPRSRLERMPPQIPRLHDTVPISRFTPDGVIPRVVNQLDTWRSTKAMGR